MSALRLSFLQRSPTEWCVIACYLETAPMRCPWPALGCCAKEEEDARLNMVLLLRFTKICLQFRKFSSDSADCRHPHSGEHSQQNFYELQFSTTVSNTSNNTLKRLLTPDFTSNQVMRSHTFTKTDLSCVFRNLK